MRGRILHFFKVSVGRMLPKLSVTSSFEEFHADEKRFREDAITRLRVVRGIRTEKPLVEAHGPVAAGANHQLLRWLVQRQRRQSDCRGGSALPMRGKPVAMSKLKRIAKF